MFRIFFLHSDPLNTQNEIHTKITSEYTVIKENRQTTPLVIKKKWICKAKPIGQLYHF